MRLLVQGRKDLMCLCEFNNMFYVSFLEEDYWFMIVLY